MTIHLICVFPTQHVLSLNYTYLVIPLYSKIPYTTLHTCILFYFIIFILTKYMTHRYTDNSSIKLNMFLFSIIKCKKHFIKMLKDVGMIVPKSKRIRLY